MLDKFLLMIQSVMKSKLVASGLVYSTDSGRMCPACRQAVAGCVCNQAKAPPPAGGVVRVFRESKGRAGKTVTVIKGVPLAEPELIQFGKKLKATCGSGGTVKDGVIEVQGDHCDLVLGFLTRQGWTAKRAGG